MIIFRSSDKHFSGFKYFFRHQTKFFTASIFDIHKVLSFPSYTNNKTIDFFFHLYYTDNASQTCGFSCVCSMTYLILKLLHNYCRETFNVKRSVGTKTFATINTRERLFTVHVPMKESVYSLSPNHAKYY